MIVWVWMAACSGPADAPQAEALPATASVEPVTDVDLPEPVSPGRPFRRMDIGQLDASIRAVTGGIGWGEAGDSEFDELSATLGVPDYLSTTTEDLGASLLFQKFLDDAANEVCDELMAREVDGGPDNVLLVDATRIDTVDNHPEAIEADLIRARLRFHGKAHAPGDPELEPWMWLFESATHVTGSTEAAWRTVCVGLLTHPDFTTF